MSAVATPPVRRLGALRDVGSGIAAVGVKELRGRMRGRRAFVVLTIHLLVVAGFAWMIETIAERSMSSGFAGSVSASADIGRAMFSGADHAAHADRARARAGLHRGRDQPRAREADARPADDDADLVAGDHPGQAALGAELGVPAPARVHPGRPRSCSRSAASGPRTWCAPTSCCSRRPSRSASMGLFVSAFVKRTQAATVINLVMTIVLTAGATFVFVFWSAMTANGLLPNQRRRDARQLGDLATLTRRPPEALLYYNPFVAQLDVICGTETGFGGTCSDHRRGDRLRRGRQWRTLADRPSGSTTIRSGRGRSR